MKTGTLTFHKTTNYGAVLQTYALQRVLRDNGVYNEVIDYDSEILTARYQNTGIRYFMNPKNAVKAVLQNSYIRDNRKSFEQFVKKHIIISEASYSRESIALCDAIYDKIIVGSDQVWNGGCMGWDSTYFLGFASPSKKNAYAASFGFDEIPDGKKEWYKEQLNGFENVSTREKSGTTIYKSLTGNEATTVLDPTLLLSTEWDELAKAEGIQIKKPYVLIYLLKETKTVFEQARIIAKKNGLQIVYINDRLFGQLGVNNMRYTTPEAWLWLFRNASAVVTNSFHGTAFSLNFNIPVFVELLPKPSRVNSRITDLLSLCGMTDRVIHDKMDWGLEVDFTECNAVLKQEREHSLRFLIDGIIGGN